MNRPKEKTTRIIIQKGSWILFAIVMVVVLWIGWYSEYNGCLRAEHAHEVQRLNITKIDNILHLNLVHTRQLHCFKFLPDH